MAKPTKPTEPKQKTIIEILVEYLDKRGEISDDAKQDALFTVLGKLEENLVFELVEGCLPKRGNGSGAGALFCESLFAIRATALRLHKATEQLERRVKDAFDKQPPNILDQLLKEIRRFDLPKVAREICQEIETKRSEQRKKSGKKPPTKESVEKDTQKDFPKAIRSRLREMFPFEGLVPQKQQLMWWLIEYLVEIFEDLRKLDRIEQQIQASAGRWAEAWCKGKLNEDKLKELLEGYSLALEKFSDIWVSACQNATCAKLESWEELCGLFDQYFSGFVVKIPVSTEFLEKFFVSSEKTLVFSDQNAREYFPFKAMRGIGVFTPLREDSDAAKSAKAYAKKIAKRVSDADKQAHHGHTPLEDEEPPIDQKSSIEARAHSSMIVQALLDKINPKNGVAGVAEEELFLCLENWLVDRDACQNFIDRFGYTKSTAKHHLREAQFQLQKLILKLDESLDLPRDKMDPDSADCLRQIASGTENKPPGELLGLLLQGYPTKEFLVLALSKIRKGFALTKLEKEVHDFLAKLSERAYAEALEVKLRERELKEATSRKAKLEEVHGWLKATFMRRMRRMRGGEDATGTVTKEENNDER